MKRKNYGPKGQKVKDPAGMLVPRHERIEVNEETCKTLIEDPETKRYNFADQYEFLVFAKQCKETGAQYNVIWEDTGEYQKRYIRGFRLYDLGQYTKALNMMRSALEVNPIGINARFEICECYLKMGRLKDAKGALMDMKDYLLDACDVARFYRRMGFIALEENDPSLALACNVYSLGYEKNNMAVQEIMFIEANYGSRTVIGKVETIIRKAGIPIIKGCIIEKKGKPEKTAVC